MSDTPHIKRFREYVTENPDKAYFGGVDELMLNDLAEHIDKIYRLIEQRGTHHSDK